MQILSSERLPTTDNDYIIPRETFQTNLNERIGIFLELRFGSEEKFEASMHVARRNIVARLKLTGLSKEAKHMENLDVYKEWEERVERLNSKPSTTTST
jgi:hypothetical protein